MARRSPRGQDDVIDAVLPQKARDRGSGLRDEAPLLEGAARRYSGRLVVLGVDFQDFSGDARKFVSKYHITYPVVRDGSGKWLERYGVSGAPETFFVNADGKVVAHTPGAVDRRTLADGIRKALA